MEYFILKGLIGLILNKMTEIRINVLVASSTINGDIVDTKLVTYNEEAH